MIFQSLVNSLYAALSGGTMLISVMSQQYNCLMELYTNFTIYVTFMMIVHAFMIEYNDWYQQQQKQGGNYMYKVNGELYSVISQILA